MTVEIVEDRFDETLAARLARPERDGLALNWLGQAGFVVRGAGLRLLIDPYLSDTLADKYRGTATPHERLMPAPIAVDELAGIDLALLTHHHTDHMDPGTLVPLACRLAGLRFVAPRASRDEVLRRTGAAEDRMILLDAGESVSPAPGLKVTAIRAAHETLERDASGAHRFLGYALTFSPPVGLPVTLVHSGDTIPFEGQIEELKRLRPDLALFPVNGRSAGVPGNMALDEAVEVAAACGAPAMIAHHYGMFAFNTAALADIEAKARMPDLPIRLLAPREGLEVRLRST